MRICYLTCGFVTSWPLLTCARRSWGFRTCRVAAVIALQLSEGLRLGAVQQVTSDDHLLPRPVKRLEAYLAAEGLPLEPGASGACDRRVGTVRPA